MAGLGVEAGILNIAIGPKLVADFGSKIADLLGKEVGPAGEKAGEQLADRLGKGLDKAGRRITKGLTAPLLALGGATIKAGLTLDDAFDKIQIATGALGPELDGLKQSFEDVATTTSASFDTTAGVIGDLNTRLGLTGEPLEQLATQVINLGEITGSAVNLDNLTKTFSAFRVEPEKYAETLDNLFKISQSTGVSVDQLTGKISAQASNFLSLGFSVEESAAVLGQLDKAGIESGLVLAGLRRVVAKGLGGKEMEGLNKELDATTEAQVKAGENIEKATKKREEAVNDLAVAELKLQEVQANPKATGSALLTAQQNVEKYKQAITDAEGEIVGFQAEAAKAEETAAAIGTRIEEAAKSSGKTGEAIYTATIAQLKGLIDAGKEQEAQALALEIAGPRAYQALIRAVDEGILTSDNLTKAIEEGALGINEAFAATADFPQQVAIFRNLLNAELGKIGQEAFPVITQFLKDFLPTLQILLVEGGTLGRELLPTITGAIQSLVPFLQAALDVFLALPDDVKKLIAQVLIFTAAVGPLLTRISPLIGLATKLGPAFGLASKGISAAFGLLAANPAILGFIAIAVIIAGLAYLIIKNWESISAFFSSVFEGIQVGLQDLGEGVAAGLENLTNIIAGIIGVVIGVFSGFIGAVKAAWEAIVGVVRTVFELIKTLIVNYVTVVYVTPFRTFISIVTGIWNGLKTIVTAVFGFVRNVVLGAVVGITNVFRTLTGVFSATWRSLTDGLRAAYDFVVGIFSRIKTIVTDAIKGVLDFPSKIRGAISGIPGFGFPEPKAAGGPVTAGRSYLVGEVGPEVFVPKTSGTIVPNQLLGSMGTAGGAEYQITIVNPKQEPASTSIPNALRRAALLRG